MANVYDLEEAFKIIEDDLVNEIINGIKKTTPESVLKEDNITVWRANQLKALEDFKKRNKKYFTKKNEKELYAKINDALTEVYQTAGSSQQKKILDAVSKGLKVKRKGSDEEISAGFNGINDRKLNALMKETQGNLYKAEMSAVRFAEDSYRQIIFNSEVYFNTGTGSLTKCIDMATKSFLAAGINNVEYKNGHRVNIQSYAEMALRTAEKRAYIQGEASMRDEYGLGLVIVNRRGNACPKCMQFVGKIFNDDVYGSQMIDSRYPLLSMAIAQGLYHPNCKDIHTTYFEDITTVRPAVTKEEIDAAQKQYELEQRQRYNERQIRKYKRLADGTIDEQQQQAYYNKVKQWQQVQRQLIEDNPTLRRKYNRESVVAGVKPSKMTVEAPNTIMMAPAELEPVTFFEFDEPEEIENFFDTKTQKQWEKTTDDPELGGHNAFTIYSDSYYRAINGKLRGYWTQEEAEETLKGIDKVIASLDEHIKEYELTDNIVTFRGVDYDAFGVETFKDLQKKVGDLYNDKGFVSTSPNIRGAFKNNVKMIINVPKGKGNGAYIRNLSIYKREYEYLLPRDSTFVINSVEQDEYGYAVVRLTYIPKK